MEEKIRELIKDLEILTDSSESDFDQNSNSAYSLYIKEYNRILSCFQDRGYYNSLKMISPAEGGSYGLISGIEMTRKHREVINESKKLLYRVHELIKPEIDKVETIKTLKLVFSRFHLVVRQLRDRQRNRQILDIEDEYDVQDLLHAILKLFFDDIRPEEWTPSYAGKSSRMDFLLKNEFTVIEVKKTRKGLGAKEVGDQLIIDIDRYKEHPDCKTLFCFVYDPEGRIGNLIGLENDLSRQSDENLEVFVCVFPK